MDSFMADLDITLYTRAPVINAQNGITLARSLADASPKEAPDHVLKSRKKLIAAADSAASALTARRRRLGAVSEEDARAVDALADSLFGALRMRIQGYAALPGAEYPLAPKAAEIDARLFGQDGLSFLTLSYSSQSAAMATVLQLIEEDNLRKEIDQIAGKEFLQAIRAVLPRYEAMAKARLTAADEDVSLKEQVRALANAVVDYATKVLGMIDNDHPETLDVVRAALRPIDAHREATARRAPSPTDTQGEPAPKPPLTPPSPPS